MPADTPLTTDRTYLRIDTADEPLRAGSVTRSIPQLHRFIDQGGWFSSQQPPTYEFLFTATGSTGPTGTRRLHWYVGADTDDLSHLKRTLRDCLPPGYTIHETTTSYTAALDLPVDTDTADPPLADWEVAGLECISRGDRPDDWMLPLPNLETFAPDDHRTDATADWPLATLFDGLATTDAPALVQVLVQPRPDYTTLLDRRIDDLADGKDLWRFRAADSVARFVDEAVDAFMGPPERRDRDRDRHRRRKPARHTATSQRSATTGSRSSPDRTANVPASEARRIEALEDVAAHEAFTVNARAVAFGTDATPPNHTVRHCRRAFTDISHRHYGVFPTTHQYGSLAANRLLDDITSRTLHAAPKSHRDKLPGDTTSRAIIADADTLGAFCLTGAPALSAETRRALDPTPPERTGLELPPRHVLNRYLEADGMAIGQPVDASSDTLDTTVSLPPAVQSLHTAITGASGAGKSALGLSLLLANHQATDGADIYIDHKGDGGAASYLQMHYARYGHLDDVYYFDCEDVLPALPLLTIEPQLEAGIDRQQAVENVVDRHLELLAGYMGAEEFHSATTAVDVVEALLKALFDPVHGADTVSQHDLLIAAARMHRDGEPPATTDPHLHEQLVAVTQNSPNVFDNIMGAAIRRIRQATKDSRLTPLFTHAAADERDAWFDLRETLDEDCVVILDTSAYRDDPRTLLTLTLIGELWTALKRRQQETPTGADRPQVNLHLEEAADVATSTVLSELLSQGRAFGVGVTVMLQFPSQVRDSHPAVYRELLNDVGTHVTGQVSVDRDLAEVFATRELPRDAVADRIRELDRGQWLVRLATGFDEPRPAPFQCASRPLPRGHPAGSEPLGDTDAALFDAERVLRQKTVQNAYGIPVEARTGTDTDGEAAAAETAAVADVDAEEPTHVPFDATIPHTERLPDPVTYIDEPPYPLQCADCDARYPSSTRGMAKAIACCNSFAAVDRENVPICSVGMSLTRSERRDSDYSDAQLRLLAACYTAQQQGFDRRLEYDIVWDSMRRLAEYVGCEKAAIDQLIDDGLLSKDCTQPYVLYTVTPAGREELQISHREGVAHGDGQGDLSESSLHVAMTEAGRRLLAQRFVESADHDAVRAKGYHEVRGERLDAAALDDDGDVVGAVEAERINHDLTRAVPADFDTMAACEPDAAIWVVKNRAAAHEVLQALNDPAEGVPRVEKTYSERMAPQEFTIDTDGLTDVYTFQHLRRQQLASDGPTLE